MRPAQGKHARENDADGREHGLARSRGDGCRLLCRVPRRPPPRRDQGTVLISNNNIQMSGPRDAVIRFRHTPEQPSGQAYSAGSGEHTDEAVQKLKEHCDKIRCDKDIDGVKSYERCSGSFDSSNALVNDASCDEAVLWRWPEGVELSDAPANRRKMRVGKWKIRKTRSGGDRFGSH